MKTSIFKGPQFLRKRLVAGTLAASVMVGVGGVAPYLAVAPHVAYAADAQAASPSILLVDLEAVLANSKVGKQIRKQIQDRAKKLDGEAKERSKKIDEEAKRLSAQQGKLSRDVFDKRLADLQERQDQARQDMQIRGQALRLGADEAQSRVNTVLQSIFKEEMERYGANIMLPRAVVITASGNTTKDVTDSVVRRLDELLPSVDVHPVMPKKDSGK